MLLLQACTTSDPDPDGGPPAGGPCSTSAGYELLVGTSPPSGEGFLGFEDGADVELATGGQGGFHVFVTYAVRGYDPRGLIVRRRVSFAANGEEITESPERVNLVPPEEPDTDTYCSLRTAQWAIVCPSPTGRRVRDAELQLDVEIEDATGETARVTRTLRAVCPEGEWYEDCLLICDGEPVK